MKTRSSLTDHVMKAYKRGMNNAGFCIRWGKEVNIEIYARKYKCEYCGECKAYGAVELLCMWPSLIAA